MKCGCSLFTEETGPFSPVVKFTPISVLNIICLPDTNELSMPRVSSEAQGVQSM